MKNEEVYKMQEFINELQDLYDKVTCKVNEDFKGTKRTYVVINPSIGIYDDVVFFTDPNDIILNDFKTVLKGFLIDSCIKLDIYDKEIKLFFSTGTVSIEVI